MGQGRGQLGNTVVLVRPLREKQVDEAIRPHLALQRVLRVPRAFVNFAGFHHPVLVDLDAVDVRLILRPGTALRITDAVTLDRLQPQLAIDDLLDP
jgi:hypothetical protein